MPPFCGARTFFARHWPAGKKKIHVARRALGSDAPLVGTTTTTTTTTDAVCFSVTDFSIRVAAAAATATSVAPATFVLGRHLLFVFSVFFLRPVDHGFLRLEFRSATSASAGFGANDFSIRARYIDKFRVRCVFAAFLFVALAVAPAFSAPVDVSSFLRSFAAAAAAETIVVVVVVIVVVVLGTAIDRRPGQHISR